MKEIKRVVATPDHADPMAQLIYRSHAISYAAFKDQTWIKTRKLADYLNTWRHYWANEPADERTWLAYLDERAVGVVTVGPLPKKNRLAQPSGVPAHDLARAAYLHGIQVDPDYLGRGIGQVLMREAIGYLQEHGYTLVTLLTDEANVRARRFYEAGGWAADGVVERPPQMVKALRYCINLASPHSAPISPPASPHPLSDRP